MLLGAGTVAALAVGVLVIGIAVGRPSPALAPTPSAAAAASPAAPTSQPTTGATSSPSAAPPSAAASAAPAATAPGRPGLISRRGEELVVRAETDATPVRTLPSPWTFSADGSRLAYWIDRAGTAELHAVDLPGGADRIVARFPDRRPGGIAWSADATGLLVSVAEPGDPRFVIPRILIAVDLASGTSREVYRGIGPSGASVMPLVWRRDPEVFAVYETGPGGYHFGYTVIRAGRPPVRTEPDGQVGGMSASSDGALVAGMWLEDGSVRVWPVDDFSKQTALRVAAPERAAQARWWPGRPELAFAVGRFADGAWRDIRIERWDPASGARAVLKRLPDGGSLGGYFVRADGSGVLTQTPTHAWEVTDLRTGAVAAVPTIPGELIIGVVLIR